MDDLIEDILEYINSTTEQFDGEWGDARSLEEIKADGDMPEIYYKIKVLINQQ